MAYPLLEENVGRLVAVNGTLVESQGLAGLALTQPVEDEAVYEVIRVADGVPLFWEDHVARLDASLASAGLPPVDPAALAHDAKALVAALPLESGNLRVVVTEAVRVMHRRRHFYPPEEAYWTGVPVGTMAWSRFRPGEKAVRADYTAAVAAKLAQPGPFGTYFETLLVSPDGRIPEGSRTNVFFFDRAAGVLRTAPDADVLLGVTRRHVLEAARRAGVPVRFETATCAEMDEGRFPAVFLTGTSIGVLPVSSVEERTLGSAQDDLVSRIRKEYDRIVDEYIRTHGGGLVP